MDLHIQQQYILKRNQETLSKIQQANQKGEFDNLSIKADKIGKNLTWKIYDINKPDNCFHIPTKSHLTIFSSSEFYEAANKIYSQFIQENYVQGKIHSLQEVLKPFYEFHLDICPEPYSSTIYKNCSIFYIQIKLNQISEYCLKLSFFSTNHDNILSIMENCFIHDNNFEKPLIHLKETQKVIKEKDYLNNIVKKQAFENQIIKI